MNQATMASGEVAHLKPLRIWLVDLLVSIFFSWTCWSYSLLHLLPFANLHLYNSDSHRVIYFTYCIHRMRTTKCLYLYNLYILYILYIPYMIANTHTQYLPNSDKTQHIIPSIWHIVQVHDAMKYKATQNAERRCIVHIVDSRHCPR